MKKLLAMTAAAILLTGCASGMSPVGYALLTNVHGPVNATDNGIGSKAGSSCVTNILGIVAQGDASIATAKRVGGISKVSTADYSSSGIYPFYGKTCVNVTGD